NKLIIVVLIFIANTIAVAQGSVTKVDFNGVEKFTDFKTSAHSSVKDRERLMQQLQKLLSKSVAKNLSKDNSLEITVNNIDMAGTFVYSGNNIDTGGNFVNPNSESVRVINDADRVRFEFSYRVLDALDADAKVIKQGDVNLTERNPKLLKRQAKKYRNTNFTYTMPLFDKWLRELNSELL
ncbi:hypothetical protein MNBD_GAMMA01-1999, partial [hydrothermal vent metagenome]